MKKLMSLMVLAAAAFAGGGMLNEHNLTTAVNYLYHKQQVGTVISLGSITNTPPAALPAHLPNVPGAIPQHSPNNPPQNPSPSLQAQPSAIHENKQKVPTTAPTSAAPTQIATAPLYVIPVPSNPPPPLSIQWPDQTTSTYKASPNSESTTPLTPPTASVSNSLPTNLPIDTTPSTTPTVLPPSIATNLKPTDIPKHDNAVATVGISGSTASRPTSLDVTWAELMRKMQSLGVRNIQLTGTAGGRLKFQCEMAGQSGSKQQTFEGEGDTPQAAAQVALKRLVLFNAARRAAQNSAQRSASSTVSESANSTIPQFEPTATPDLNSAPISPSNQPLSPPPDLPN